MKALNIDDAAAATEIVAALSKAGCEAPTGARIEGVLRLLPEIALINDDYGDGLGWDTRARHDGWQDEAELIIVEGRPVFADDDHHTWVIGDDDRWQPVSVRWEVSGKVLDPTPRPATEEAGDDTTAILGADARGAGRPNQDT